MSKTKKVIGSNEPQADGSKLVKIIEDIERNEEKKAGISQIIGEIYAHAKNLGYDKKTIRTIIKERKIAPEQRREQEELLAVYRSALGMLDD